MPKPIPTPAVCEHLRPVAEYLAAQGAKINYAGQAWSNNCRVWIYYDVLLDCEALIRRFSLPATNRPPTRANPTSFRFGACSGKLRRFDNQRTRRSSSLAQISTGRLGSVA